MRDGGRVREVVGLGPGGGGWVVDDHGSCRVADETVRNPPGVVPDGMRRNPARFVWSIVTLAFAALAGVPPLWLWLQEGTADCVPVDQGGWDGCEFAWGLILTLYLGVGLAIFGPLALGSAVLWRTRKKYLPEAGSPRKDRRHSSPPNFEEPTVSDPPPIPPNPEDSHQPPSPSSAGYSPERPATTTPASVSTEADEGQTPWRKDGRPTAALVCGILGLFFFPLAIVAWIVGTRAARSIKRGESDPSRLGTARAGKILGIVGVLVVCYSDNSGHNATGIRSGGG